MAEYTYPLSKERMLEILKEMSKPQPRRPFIMYMNGKMIKQIYGEHMNVDEHSTYLIEMDWSETKTRTKKKYKKKR